MNGLTTQERLNDICKISGLSEAIVRRVLDAERMSVAKSLRKGERATLIGRCVIRPEIRSKIETGGEMGMAFSPITRSYIKLSAQVAPSMEAMLQDLSMFEQSEKEEVIPNVLTKQISALV